MKTKDNGESWEPSAEDILWTVQTLARVRHGGVWATSWAVYQVDHHFRTLVMVAGTFTEGHERIKKVLNKMGWMMAEPLRPADPPFGQPDGE